MSPQKLIEERGTVECPYCQSSATVEWREDSDGEFEITSCDICGWVKIVDPDNKLLQGEARPLQQTI